MALFVTDHISTEVGHLRGISRILTAGGMLLVGVGVLAFFGAVVLGLFGSGGTTSLQLLPLGGLAVVVGTVVASIGMTLARRVAGE